ncbi:MAG: AMP-binding protein [Paracoccus sp. (in: a-proteobacteria)]|uniref:AMP-binding protein n=1 Tax=Paracoccus sp. TaxID=267 RepID=UPI004059CAD3
MASESIYRLLADNLPANSSKTALIDAARSVTYAELVAEADVVADYLTRIGIRAGDRVIVHLRKGIEEVAAMFGVAKIGAVVVNVNHQWTAQQLIYVAENSGARALVTQHAALKDLPGGALPPVFVGVLLLGDGDPPNDLCSLWRDQSPTAEAQEAAPAGDDLAMIIYTSGSTGMPKGVMLSHRNIRIGAESVIAYLGLRADDRLLSVLPYSFDAGLNQLTTMLMTGGSVVHQPVAMPSELVRSIRDHSVTGFAGVPPLWNQVVRYLDQQPEELPSLRLITNTGGKIPPDILERMPDVFPGVDIFLMYGLTEAFRSTYLPPAKFAAKKGSIGRAIPNAQVHVIQHGRGRAGPGEQGELVHGGPLVSLGYWQQPELTRQKIRPCPELADLLGDAPVVYSGDLVRVDEDGDLWFVGRIDDMIKTSGFRLSPTEVEDLVSQSGMVLDVVAYGVEDHDMGQVVHVAIAPQDGFEHGKLLAHCRRSMPHYMVPRHIHEWPGAMPRTASGKLDRPAVIRASKAASGGGVE